MTLIQQDIPLSSYSTLGIGGPAKFFIEIRTYEEASKALEFAKARKLPFVVIGKGSNCLFDDQGFDGLVIYNRIDFLENHPENTFFAGAGYSFSLLGSQTARKGYSGLEFASGIPGSVGGAVFMNAGANGRETFESLSEVVFMDSNGNIETFMRKDIVFDYRYSSFHNMPGLILAAKFQLTPSSEARSQQINIITKRKESQPLKEKSAGCIFRNPTNQHSGELIDQCGLKGFSIGGAEVSDCHANFIINKGSATAEDYRKLIKEIQQKVFEDTGHKLASEIRHIPLNMELPW